MQVDFYQLGAQPVEQVLPRIAERVTGEGGRLLIVAENEALLKRLDEGLWSYDPTSFLPHARAGQDDDTDQPILLAPGPTPANNARNIALADGQWREDALTYDRAFHLFDSATLAAARDAWKALRDMPDIDRRFWKQEDGKWTQIV